MKIFLAALISLALHSFASVAQKTMADVASLTTNAPKNKKLVKMPAEKLAAVSKKYPLLASIESYDPTRGGKQKKPFTETYDYRMTSGATLPPSLVDCFITDLMMLYKKERNETLSATSVPAEAAMQAMEVYRKNDASNVIGYRPFTHWSFVRGLSAEEQQALAKEVAAYAAEYGVKER